MTRRLNALLLPLAAPSGGDPAAAAADPDAVGVWPLSPAPEVVRGFDPPDDPWGSGHRGVDLRGSPGQRVVAALPGEVSFAGMLAGRGVVVVAHDDGTRTTYEPVAASVRVGDRVAGGDPLGRLTWAGTHCPPDACLHWGWRRGDTYLDPLTLVGGGPVRLLPLWSALPTGGAGPSAVAPAWVGWQPLARAGWDP
jgi:murein DD-endopeptidase MepM/ murein hydrolase activator NlpD